MAVYIIAQFIYHYITQGYLPDYTNLNFVFESEKRVFNHLVKSNAFYRPSGFFAEPSYYTLFAFPAIVDYLFSKKRNYFCVLLISLAMIFGQALSGVVVVIFLLGLFLISEIMKKNIIPIFIVFLAFLIIILLFSNNDFFEAIIGRLKSGGSFNNRITRGAIIYSNLTKFHKIFGVGINNISNYMQYYSIKTPFDESDLGVFNTVFQLLNSFGLIGITFFLGIISELGKKINLSLCANILLWVFLLVIAYENVLFSYRFAFYVILIQAWKEEYTIFIEDEGAENENSLYRCKSIWASL
ncbi:MAG: hypothetical protein PHD05_03585 [Sphaerochaetaceae bacterium]|nr:hypothetical protein [Sphaerochaetaceae bacterium]